MLVGLGRDSHGTLPVTPALGLPECEPGFAAAALCPRRAQGGCRLLGCGDAAGFRSWTKTRGHVRVRLRTARGFVEPVSGFPDLEPG